MDELLHLSFQHVKESRKIFDLSFFKSFAESQCKISVSAGYIFKRALPRLTGAQDPGRQYAVSVIQCHQFNALAAGGFVNIFRSGTDIVAAAIEDKKPVNTCFTAVFTETPDCGKGDCITAAVDIKGQGRSFRTEKKMVVTGFMTVSGKVKDKHVSCLQRRTDPGDLVSDCQKRDFTVCHQMGLKTFSCKKISCCASIIDRTRKVVDPFIEVVVDTDKKRCPFH